MELEIMTFEQKLDQIITKNNSLLCVGLDPVLEKLPEKFKNLDNPFFEFNKWIIDQTAQYVASYKPNSAFYEAEGTSGIEQLKMTCDYLSSNYPEIPIILDAKRGDIGNTNDAYARYAFEYLKADGLTVIPYLGIKSLEPFFNWSDKAIIIGCHSSNPEGIEIQELSVIPNLIRDLSKNEEMLKQVQHDKDVPLYLYIARLIMKYFGDNPNTMIFMGATFPEQLSYVRKIVGDMTFLVPGVGSQGGNLEETLKFGLNSKKKGLIINSSRGIIFSESPKIEAEKLREEINKFRL